MSPTGYTCEPPPIPIRSPSTKNLPDAGLVRYLLQFEFPLVVDTLMVLNNLLTKTLLAAVCAAALMEAHSAGTTQAAAGVPGEGSCTSCHTMSSPGSGALTITFPSSGTYQPGVKQHLKLTITDANAKRWGFQVTARLLANTQVQAGSFTPGSDSQFFCTQVGFVNNSVGTSCPSQQPLTYVEQTYDGTHVSSSTAPGSITYEFDWTPPSDTNAGSVVFYAAGLASNNDGGTGGDTTYVARFIVFQATTPLQPIISSVQNVSGVQSTITQGGVIVINGSGLAGKSRSIADSELINGQFPTSADGVSVTVAGAPAYIMRLDPKKLTVAVHEVATLGLVPVVVTNNGLASSAFSADLEPVAPALFLRTGNYVTATHSSDGTPVAPALAFLDQPSSPAKSGETINLITTGLGITNPSIAAGIVTTAPGAVLKETPVVLIGGQQCVVNGAALVPGLTGVYQVSVVVPQGLPNGDAAVTVQVSGVQSDPGFVIPVRN